MQTSFVLEYWEDDGWLVGRLRGIPGIFSQGRTLSELEENIRDAYSMMTADETPAPEGARTKEFAIEA